MTRSSLLLTALLASATPVLAQPAPFDMSPESDLRIETPRPAAPTPAAPAAPAVVAPQRSEHFILPATARLNGEQSRVSTVVYLTQAQAEAAAQLKVSYLNALVVAPEISSLTIRINNSEVGKQALSASAAPSPVAIDVPAGLLRQGANTIEFVVTQRHRTDCSVRSTFELWTEIPPASAVLSFEGVGLGQVRQLSELAAIGVDENGATTVRLIAPALGTPDATRAAMIFAQQLTLAMRVPGLRIEQATELSPAAQPGVLDVVLATAEQLPDSLAEYRAQASSGGVAALVPRPSGANTLLVSGPDWTSISQASMALVNASPVTPDRPRIDLPEAIPVITGGETFSLSELGVPTIEFNGRRLSLAFQFSLPPDFYANSYGEAELVLDAAYSADVLPGSEIDIYTNSQIASATPLLRTDGGLLRDTVIRFPMTHLRPGRNVVEVVVNLNAQSDAVCSPGWTGRSPVRFVFSSSSQFRMPDYARAASLPDLELYTGSAWPYVQDPSVPLVLGSGPDTALAAMTLMARTAAASEQVMPVAVIPEAELRPEQDAILVMPVTEMSSPTLNRTGLANAPASGINRGDVLDQFITEGNQANPLLTFAEETLQRVGLTLEDLRVLPRAEAPHNVASGSVVMAQSAQPEGGLWTVLSGSDAASIRTGMERLAVTAQWRQIDGRVSSLLPSDTDVKTVAAVAPVVVQTQPFSLQNFRLVVANWFSGNILLFTAALGLAALVLMMTTAAVLGKVGRK